MPTYSRFNVTFVKGDGPWLFDQNNNKYLDFLSGLGVTILGHAHPEVAEEICMQAKRLIHTSNLFHTEPQQQLANKLSGLSLGGSVFLSNSGAEANECAIKLARKYGNEKLGGAYEIISAERSFHGRTLAALAATGQPEKQEGFGPMPEGFKYFPFNDFEALKRLAAKKTCAVLLEVVQGEGGVYVADKEFLAQVQELCKQNGILLMIDEVQTGMARTGRFFAYQHFDIEPDVISVAKGLANGLPIGATISRPGLQDILGPGKHATTFGGGPVPCSAAIKTIEIIEKNDLVDKNKKTGELLKAKLKTLAKETGWINEIRGLGLMVACELKEPVAKQVVDKCLEKGLIVNNVKENAIRFLPPYLIGEEEINLALAILEESLLEMKGTNNGA